MAKGQETIVQWHERMVNSMAALARVKDQQLATYTGERAFGAVRLSPTVQLAQYDMRRNDDQFWTQMIAAGQWQEIEQYVKRFEPLYRVGGQESTGGGFLTGGSNGISPGTQG